MQSVNERHKYDYDVDLTDENCAATKVLRLTGSGKRVLEIGAGPGTITRILKEQGSCTVSAVEIDSGALPHLQPYCEAVFQRDLNAANWSDGLAIPEGYEVIVAADVFEHLLDPWSTLAQLKSLLAPEGSVVISLPHAGHNGVIAALLNGNFRYHDWGLLDRTHIRFFGLQNIEEFMTNAGYAIEEVDYVRHAPQAMELADLWHKLPEETRRALEASSLGDIYQVVLRAHLQTDPSKPGIHLRPPAGERPAGAPGTPLKSVLRRARSLLRRTLARTHSNG